MLPMSTLIIPKRFLHVPYNSRYFPGAPESQGLQGGANCQQFAYELLRHFGKTIPNFRSSELWEDELYTLLVRDQFKPLDLLLWHKQRNPYGAHVGVYIGEERAIHLAKEIKKPVIWPLSRFMEEDKYKIFFGAKRIRTVSQ